MTTKTDDHGDSDDDTQCNNNLLFMIAIIYKIVRRKTESADDTNTRETTI